MNPPTTVVDPDQDAILAVQRDLADAHRYLTLMARATTTDEVRSLFADFIALLSERLP